MAETGTRTGRYEKPRVSTRGVLLTLAGVVVGSAGYYISWRYQAALGTLGGVAGLALCVIGTSKGHDGT
ncbi:hypothetical protein OPKNFCMD_3004 [Methylobacterium crusticola]|uniref:Uncharacterized protein n=1 Tax=Methylobacterium crusticola TaxID=1697972 RepID=A0ABQ4QY14_9HYPH|nr:hypothetical protein [Methylobacterium crusticola]GJD50266.1 hypothetical protein OPKNFCMD_3004 [Methylobacterium crusticola]